MPRPKKTAAEKEEKKTKVTKALKKAADAAAKKTAVKKSATKKASPKKTAAKKPTEPKINFYVEFGGVQVSIDEVIANIKAAYGKNAKEISVYLKPEDSKAYFVADGENGNMDVFFC